MGTNTKAKIIITVPTLGRTRVEWGIHFRTQLYPFGRGFGVTAVIGTKPPSAARNLCIHEGVRRNAEYVIFYDDDVLPLADSAIAHLVTGMEMLPPKVAILSGVVPMRIRDFPEPMVLKEAGGGPWYEWDDGGVHPVYMGGISLAIVRIAALERLVVPEVEVEGQMVREYFRMYDEDPEAEFIGTEDFYFAELLIRNGLEWWVHGSVICDQIDLDGYRFSLKGMMAKRKELLAL